MVSAFEQLGGNGKVNSVLEKHLDAYIENAASPSPSSSSLSSPSSPLSSLTFSGKPSVRSDYSSRGAYIRAKYDGVFATPLHMNEMQERQKAVNSRRLEHQRTQRLVDRFLVVGRGPLIKIPPRTKREHDTSSVAVLSPVHNSGAGVSPGNHADHDRGTTHEDLTVTVDDLLGAEFEPTLLDGYPLSSHFVSTLYKQKDKIKDEIVTCRGDSDGRYTSDYTDDDEDRDKYEQGDEDRDSDKKRKVKEEEDMHSENPPPNLSMFLFPENVKLESTCKDPTCFTFVFTKVNGLRQYGVCLRFYECLDQTSVDCLRKEGREWKEEKCSNKDHDKTDSADNEINSQVSLSPSLPSSSSPPFSSTPASSSSPQCCPVVYQPVSIALVSQYPMYSVMECFLKLLYRISLSSPPIPLERFISNFMNEVRSVYMCVCIKCVNHMRGGVFVITFFVWLSCAWRCVRNVLMVQRLTAWQQVIRANNKMKITTHVSTCVHKCVHTYIPTYPHTSVFLSWHGRFLCPHAEFAAYNTASLMIKLCISKGHLPMSSRTTTITCSSVCSSECCVCTISCA